MPKPRKKYDPNKMKKWMSRVAERNSMLIQAQGLGGAGKIWVFHNKPVPKGEWLSAKHYRDYELTFLTPHKWTVIAGVACRDPLGNTYFSYADQQSNNEFIYYDPQIQQWIIEFTAEQIQDVNREHILSSFFIAIPKQDTLSKEDIEKLLHWLGLFNADKLKTHYEMTKIKAAAEADIQGIPLEEFLPKQTACVLRKHGIPDLLTLFWQDEDHLKQLKGIGEKRYTQIGDGLKALAAQFPNFYELAYDNYRADQAREFIFQDVANAEAIYQAYLERKTKKCT